MFAALQDVKSAVVLTMALLLGSGPALAEARTPDADPLVQSDTPAANDGSQSGSPAQPQQSPTSGYRLQIGDEPSAPHEAVHPRSDEEQAELDAATWYMTGRLLQARNRFEEAYRAYSRAVERNPKSTAIYRELVPLAFDLKKSDAAVQYARKAVELDPDDFELLRELGIHMVSQRKFPAAVEFLSQAAQSSRLEKTSSTRVLLMRDLGILYRLLGQIDKAADCYEVIFDALVNREKYDLEFQTRARLLSDESVSFEQIGQIFLQAKRPNLAIQAFEQAAKARKGNPGHLSYNLANVYLQTGKPERALKELQRYFDAQLQSKGKAAYQLLADILNQLDKADELIPKLEALAQEDPRNSTLQFFLASQYVGADRLDEAEMLYKQVLSKVNEFEGHVGLADIYFRQKRPAPLLEALVNAQEAVSNDDPEEFEALLEQIAADRDVVDQLIAAGRELQKQNPEQFGFEANYLLAKFATETHQAEPAVEFTLAAFKSGSIRSADTYKELGDNLFQFKEFDKAGDIYQAATENPALIRAKPNFLILLSRARELAGKTQEALQALGEVKQVAPDQPLVIYQEGWIYYHSHQWEKAIPLFERVISRHASPASKDIVRLCQFSLSNIYVQQGDIEKGEKILEEILAADPDDPSVNNDLGYLWADQGKKLDQAEKMVRKAIAAEPENVAYLDSMGWVLYKQGKYDEALTYLEKAASQPSGADATIWDHLADCYARLKRLEKAKETWQKALEHAQSETRPDEKLIKKIQEKLAGDGGPADSP